MQIKKKSTKYSFPANELNKNGTAYKKTFYHHSYFRKKALLICQTYFH